MSRKDDDRNIYSSSDRRQRYQPSYDLEDTFEDIYAQAKRERKNKPYRSQPDMPPSKRKKKKKSLFRRFLSILLVLVFLVAICLTGGFFYLFSGLDTNSDFTTDPADLGLSSASKIDSRVTNIALFGVDSRDGSDTGRSDTVMVASIDGIHHEIKLTSILRDSRVSIDGHGMDKLAHAYAYGGAELAVKTLNQNFDLDIMEYVTVNFAQMADIIDAIGGVDITMTSEERTAANGLIASTPDLSYSPEIPKFSGDEATLHLNGAQAVAYARIRKIDNESARASRQQVVMQAMFDQIADMSILQYPSLLKDLLPYVETSLSTSDILRIAPTVMLGSKSIRSNIIPDQNDPDVIGGTYQGTWYWRYDLDDYTDKLHDFIYNQS